MRSRSIVLCLVVSLLLSVMPLHAASRQERSDGFIDRIVRVIKRIIAPITNGDAMIPPTP